jgi:flagellar FliL protein
MPEEEMEMEVEGGEKKKKKSPLLKIIILVVLLLVLGAGGFFGWQYFMAEPEPQPEDKAAKEDAASPEEGAEEGEEGAKNGKKAQEAQGTVINLEPFVVNLADRGGKRYLRLSLAVDAKEEKIRKEIEARMPIIRDSILLLLTSKSYGDISNVSGKLRLRNEVLQAFNRALAGKGSVHAVYFTEFVVQ